MNSESVDLIYLDPPFNSKRTYSAPVGSKAAGASFKDMWTWADVDESCLEKMITEYPYLIRFIQAIEGIHGKPMMSYITYMAQRLIEMHRVLKPTGSLYLHCDPTASHYLKIILDRIFGSKNFRNEIIWCYGSPSQAKKTFARKHDTILFYAKSNETPFNWEEVLVPHKRIDKRLVSGFDKSVKHADQLTRGKKCFSWWDDIAPAYKRKAENMGYPTQKPLKLLERIIKASSNRGDVVLDPFAGCATTCVASQQLDRKWIGIDIEEKAADLVIQRLSDDAGMFSDFVHRVDIPERTDVKIEEPNKSVKDRLHKDQKGECKGCKVTYNPKDLEIDHITPRVKGGGNYFRNYQLLCSNCNRIKGPRHMEYLMARVAKNEAHLKANTYG